MTLEEIYEYIDNVCASMNFDKLCSFQMKYIMKNIYEENNIKLAVIGDGNDVMIHELCNLIHNKIHKKVNVLHATYSHSLTFESIGRFYTRNKKINHSDYYRDMIATMPKTFRGIEHNNCCIVAEYVGTDTGFNFINEYGERYTTVIRFISMSYLVNLEDTVKEYTECGFRVI